MKFRKPQDVARWFVNIDLIGEDARELQRFVDSLPDEEFEIVPEGHVCVKWPEGVTKRWLDRAANELMNIGRSVLADDVRSIADIAPEREKLEVNLWRRFSGEQCWNECESMQPGWRKVAGPIEIDD